MFVSPRTPHESGASKQFNPTRSRILRFSCEIYLLPFPLHNFLPCGFLLSSIIPKYDLDTAFDPFPSLTRTVRVQVSGLNGGAATFCNAFASYRSGFQGTINLIRTLCRQILASQITRSHPPHLICQSALSSERLIYLFDPAPLGPSVRRRISPGSCLLKKIF